MSNSNDSSTQRKGWTHNPLLANLIPSVLAAGIFAFTIAYFGSVWQQDNWKEQNRISTQNALEQKKFEIKHEAFNRGYASYCGRMNNLYNYTQATNIYKQNRTEEAMREMAKYRDLDQSLIFRTYSAASDRMRIFSEVFLAAVRREEAPDTHLT